MLDALRQGRTDPAACTRLRPLLAAGPWLWPTAGSLAFDTACRIAGRDAPPDAAGRVPAVTVRASTATLWYLDLHAGAGSADLGAVARRSWEQARAALPRSLPVLLSSLRPYQRPPSAVRLGWHLDATGWARPETVIEGPSLGLAFFLHLAALVSRVPVVPDAVASATIDDAGRLGPVNGLRLKIAAVVNLAPRIRRFIVCADQAAEAREWVAGRLEVLAFASAAEAAEALYNDALVSRLVDCSAGERQHITDTLLRLVLSERGLTSWSPVHNAARRALDTWTDLDRLQRHALAFVAAVSARHQDNSGRIELPPADWLARLPRPMRLHVVAHVVQHSADTGTPAPEQALALGRAALTSDPREAFAPELRVHGAMGRLLASTGHPEQALPLQEELALVHFDGLGYDEVSRPLCEWLRLAAALGDRPSFDRALALREKLKAVGAASPGDDAFLALAEARGAILLATPEAPHARRVLARLARSHAIPDHVRRSAARWRLLAARQTDARASELDQARADFEEACPAQAATLDGHVFRALACLDEALEGGDAAAAQAAVDDLRAHSPGLVANLTTALPPEAQPAHVARFYPY